jgi:hypothetical protein
MQGSFASSPLTRFPNRSSSATSDPIAEAFLTHIRASQEARAAKKKKEEEKIFVDEDAKGFLNSEPL